MRPGNRGNVKRTRGRRKFSVGHRSMEGTLMGPLLDEVFVARHRGKLNVNKGRRGL